MPRPLWTSCLSILILRMDVRNHDSSFNSTAEVTLPSCPHPGVLGSGQKTPETVNSFVRTLV